MIEVRFSTLKKETKRSTHEMGLCYWYSFSSTLTESVPVTCLKFDPPCWWKRRDGLPTRWVCVIDIVFPLLWLNLLPWRVWSSIHHFEERDETRRDGLPTRWVCVIDTVFPLLWLNLLLWLVWHSIHYFEERYETVYPWDGFLLLIQFSISFDWIYSRDMIEFWSIALRK